MLKLSYSKPFHNTSNYASTANIEEVMKFYNQGDKTFETAFKFILNSHPHQKRISFPIVWYQLKRFFVRGS